MLHESTKIVFDLNALNAHPTGLMLSTSVRLEPGRIQAFTFPLNQLICVVNGHDVPLHTLLKQGYTVRASFEVRGTRVASPDFSFRK